MDTTSTDACDVRRVGECTVDGTTQTGGLATSALGTSGIEIGALEAIDAPQEEEISRCSIAEDDGIGPDDAPEVAPEDVDEEVCAHSCKHTAASLISIYST